MNIKLNKLLTILLISGLVESSKQSCSAAKDNDKQCGYYCYEIVKPLLQYVASLKEKEQLYNALELKVHDLETTITHMENTIRDKEKQMQMQFELSQVYKEKSVMSEELIKQKNEQIQALQNQILQNLNSKTNANENIIMRVETPKNLATESTVNAAENENIIMQVETPTKSITESIINNQNPLIASTNNANSHTDQTILPISQIGIPDAGKPAEIRNLESNSYNIDKYLGKNCVGKASDVYMLKVPGIEHFAIPCDSTLAGSGWTVIQRRIDGTENFNRNWTDYQTGFGDLRKEFFIGLDKLHLITNGQPHELYIHLEDFNNEIRYAQYSHFIVGDENESYAIKSLGEYFGNAENALLSHKNMKFSTADRYSAKDLNCAEIYKSGWWFNDGCYLCNLNGQYVSQNIENSNAIEWRTWHFRPLKFVQMMIRPKNIK